MEKYSRLKLAIRQLREQVAVLERQLQELEEQEAVPVAATNGHSKTNGAGPSTFDLLSLSDSQTRVFNVVNQRGKLTASQIASALSQTESHVQSTLHELIESQMLQEIYQTGIAYYELFQFQRQGRELPADLWDVLESRIN